MKLLSLLTLDVESNYFSEPMESNVVFKIDQYTDLIKLQSYSCLILKRDLHVLINNFKLEIHDINSVQ